MVAVPLPCVPHTIGSGKPNRCKDHYRNHKAHSNPKVDERTLARFHVRSYAASNGTVKRFYKDFYFLVFFNGARPPLCLRYSRAREPVDHLIDNNATLLWIDNFNRSRFSKNLDARRDAGVNCTAVAVYVTLEKMPPAAGWPTLSQLVSRASCSARMQRMKQTARGFIDGSSRLHNIFSEAKALRCPLDILRDPTTVPPWMPYSLLLSNISTTEGLLEVLEQVNDLATRDGGSRRLPLMCDINIFYRIAKMVYARQEGDLWVPVRIDSSLWQTSSVLLM